MLCFQFLKDFQSLLVSLNFLWHVRLAHIITLPVLAAHKWVFSIMNCFRFAAPTFFQNRTVSIFCVWETILACWNMDGATWLPLKYFCSWVAEYTWGDHLGLLDSSTAEIRLANLWIRENARAPSWVNSAHGFVYQASHSISIKNHRDLGSYLFATNTSDVLMNICNSQQ